MEKHRYILSLDQGTTSSRAIIFDENGEIKSRAQAEYAQIYPRDGWVEHDPIEIFSSVAAVASEAIARGGINRNDITAIGITNQRETTIVWDKTTGAPVYNAIVWQCRRTADICDKLKADGLSEMIYKKTGLPVDAYFSATKIKWILDNVDGAREKAEKGELLFGTVDTYLMWKLSAGRIFATDFTNASRTMLYNIHTLEWDDELLSLFGVPRCMLPDVLPSSEIFGYTDEGAFGAKIPIAGVAGDQQAALFGQRCFTRGSAKNTFGTGCFLLMNTGAEAVESRHGLITTLAAMRDGTPHYALEGSVFVGGAVVQWLRDEMRLVRTAAETEQYALSVTDTLGMYLVPAFVGLGAPYWDAYARGTVTGITRGTNREHFIRAALESIAYQVNDVLCAMEKDCGGMCEKRLAVDGGASENSFLMQFTADITGHTVVRPSVVESTALGAAYLAGLATGLYSMETLSRHRNGDSVFSPNMDGDTRKKLIDGWRDAVKRTMHKD
ncbi:MAG: glycerol kinase GlpK [Clostridiales bacterium]|nr:glycerol kinase GlpK [Clostridiales bacterium]